MCRSWGSNSDMGSSLNFLGASAWGLGVVAVAGPVGGVDVVVVVVDTIGEVEVVFGI